MSERSKGFKAGAIGLFIAALSLLTYIWSTNGDDGPSVVPHERTAAEAAAEEVPPPGEAMVSGRSTDEAPPAAETSPESNEPEITPDRVKQARSLMN